MAVYPFWVAAVLALQYAGADAKPMFKGKRGCAAGLAPTLNLQPVQAITETPVLVSTFVSKNMDITYGPGQVIHVTNAPTSLSTVVTKTATGCVTTKSEVVVPHPGKPTGGHQPPGTNTVYIPPTHTDYQPPTNSSYYQPPTSTAYQPPTTTGYNPPTSSYYPPPTDTYTPPTSTDYPTPTDDYNPPTSTDYPTPTDDYNPPTSTDYPTPTDDYNPPTSTDYPTPTDDYYPPISTPTPYEPPYEPPGDDYEPPGDSYDQPGDDYDEPDDGYTVNVGGGYIEHGDGYKPPHAYGDNDDDDDDCDYTLPPACASLGKVNGLDILGKIPACTALLGPLASAATTVCLATANILPTSKGSSVISCLDATLSGWCF